MDWYQLSPDDVAGGARTIAIDLRNVHSCNADRVCEIVSLPPLSGMFPTLATVTLWSSLGFAALVAFQACARVLTGSANDSLTKLGYMLALMTISLTVATAYMFGREPGGIDIGVPAQVGIALHRTWAPLTLLAGHVAGFATLYIAVAPESSDLHAAYRPMTFAPTRTMPGKRAKILSALPSPLAAPTSQTNAGLHPPIPEHLRNQLSYVALTAELTAGGIDARREDGSARLVLWRDVVGVVARRLPPVYDNPTFIDIVSTAGSTLRIVPWTRLTGDPIGAEGDARPRSVALRVVAMCPDARLDPATRQFLDSGEAAQLPDRATYRRTTIAWRRPITTPRLPVWVTSSKEVLARGALPG